MVSFFGTGSRIESNIGAPIGSTVFIKEVQDATRAVGGFARVVNNSILPILGLGAALSILGPGLNENTASGRAAASQFWEMQAAMFGVQEAATRALLPVITELVPWVTAVGDAIEDADEATKGWSTRLLLAAAALGILYKPAAALVRAAGRAPRVAGPAGAIIGPGIAAAAEDVEGIQNPQVALLLRGLAALRFAQQGAFGAANPLVDPFFTHGFFNPIEQSIRRANPAGPTTVNNITIQSFSADEINREIQSLIDTGQIHSLNR